MTTPTEFEHETERPLTPARIIDAIRRRRWTALIIAAATFAAAYAVSLSLPNLYRASATVLVQRKVSEELVKASIRSDLETRIQSIHEYVTSRQHLSGMIDEMHLYPGLRAVIPIDDLAAMMRGDITLQVKSVSQPASGGATTIAFTVGYTGSDPQTVAAVVNNLVEVYTAENTTNREREASTTAEFLRQQLEQVRRSLDGQDRETRAFSMAHTEELPQQLQANLAALERVHGELTLNGEQQLQLAERRERLEQEVTLGAVLVPPANTTSSQARLVALRQQLATLRRTFNDEYPDVKRTMAEIAAVEADAARASAGASAAAVAVDPGVRRRQEIQDLDTELRALKQHESELRARSAQLEAIVGSTPKRQIELDQLSRGHDSTSLRYQALLQQYEDAQQAATLEQRQGVEQFTVLDPALPPRHPVAPDRQMIDLLGLAAALVMAGLAIAAREKFDTTLHAPDDLRDLVGAPVIALRRVPTRRGRRLRWLHAALATVVAIAVIGGAFVAARHLATGNERIVRMTLRGNA